ncbi:PREDICTED: uncharacterized protein LOC108766423 [Trachymyrmex cornetzi]|uniref:uncharacterized protein LOC108766423 n=1 Tax=Trachymyrmex cornetzi TaxID=471704 RepID=UPI00084F25EE|nr:PREDICTED: uncharacterized protein LOC108766423 [Trachymyrmex cornetzi]
MTKQLAQLKQKRARIKGQITRIQNFFDENDKVSVSEAQVRLKRLEEAFSRFEIIQDEIDEIKEIEDEEGEDAESEMERKQFEERYYKAAATAQGIIDNHQHSQVELQQNLVRNNNGTHREERHRPVIKLPEFSGEYTKWMFFKDSFETIIHQDAGLTPMQKHQFLIGVLQGEARSVIQGFKISNENYENAWTLLKETYDNKMMIIQTHLDELLTFPVITKDNKAESIRQFIWHIQTHVSSFKVLAQPVNYWETIIIHLTKKKLDFIEQRDWQDTVKDKTPEDMPTLTEFLKFLNDRCHIIRVLEQGKTKVVSNGKQQQKIETKKEKGEKRVTLSTIRVNCRYCNDDHPTYKCEELLKLSAPEGTKSVIEKRLCINCFAPGHFGRDCRGSSCRKCDRKHNTLLHIEKEEPTTQGNSKNNSIVTHVRAEDDKTIKEEDSVAMNIYCAHNKAARVMLSIAQVYVRDSDGNQQACRALLDPGSQLNLITTSLHKKLKLPFTRDERHINGINQIKTSANKITRIQLESKYSNYSTEMECLVFPRITEQLPQTKIDVAKIYVPRDAQLADPAYNIPGPIEILIGEGVYWKILIG